MFRIPLLLLVLFVTVFSGSASASERIVGGNNTSPSRNPWIASLVDRDEPSAYVGHFCGATLINPRWLLTAAHCAEFISEDPVDAVFGKEHMKRRGGLRVAVAGVRIHPGYSDSNYQNDIALLRLARPINRQKLFLSKDPAPLDKNLHLAGWGATATRFPVRLQEAYVKRKGDSVCESAYGVGNYISSLMFCASDLGRDSCVGDSGGPVRVGNRVVGVVSWGNICADPAYPGVYARVDKARNWITGVIKRLKKKRWPSPRPGRDGSYKAPRPSLAATYFVSSAEDSGGIVRSEYQGTFSMNYSYREPRARFTGSGSKFCLDIHTCASPGQSLPMTLMPGHRSSYLTGTSDNECIDFYHSAEIVEPGPHQGKRYGVLAGSCSRRYTPAWHNGRLGKQVRLVAEMKPER